MNLVHMRHYSLHVRSHCQKSKDILTQMADFINLSLDFSLTIEINGVILIMYTKKQNTT